jgi:hypothetical protein
MCLNHLENYLAYLGGVLHAFLRSLGLRGSDLVDIALVFAAANFGPNSIAFLDRLCVLVVNLGLVGHCELRVCAHICSKYRLVLGIC